MSSSRRTPLDGLRRYTLQRIHKLARQQLLAIGRHLLTRPALQPLNRLIFETSLRGMGVLNYKDMFASGEAWFIGRLAEEWSRTLKSGQITIIDVGANEGSFSALALKAMPTADIHAFEPHPQTVERLRERLGSVATVIPAAVGATSGSLELFDYKNSVGSSHASPYHEVFADIHRRPASALTVSVLRLDAYIDETGLAEVHLLKVDTEGHELEVLKGAAQNLEAGAIHCLQFEFNEMNVISRTFLRDFAKLLPEFALFRLLPRGLLALRGEPLDEIFAFQNIVAIHSQSPIFPALVRAEHFSLR